MAFKMRDDRYGIMVMSVGLSEAMWTKCIFSTVFHSLTDGYSERMIRMLEDMMRGCVLDLRVCGVYTSLGKSLHTTIVSFEYMNGSVRSSLWSEVKCFNKMVKFAGKWTLMRKKLEGPDSVVETRREVESVYNRLSRNSVWARKLNRCSTHIKCVMVENQGDISVWGIGEIRKNRMSTKETMKAK